MRALSLLVLFVLAACTGSASSSAPAASAHAASAAPTGTSADPSPQPGVDLDALDVCTVLTVAQVQEITGVNAPFEGRGTSHASDAKCFWGAHFEPAYVEISVFRRKDGLATWNPSPSCAATALSGLGDEAKGAICAPNPQQKVWLAVADEGLVVTVLVNEPQRPLGPEDLAETFRAVSEHLR